MATYKSFRDAFAVMGYTSKTTAKTTEKEIKCKICGGVMKLHADTNILTCTGHTDEQGTFHPCSNYILWNN